MTGGAVTLAPAAARPFRVRADDAGDLDVVSGYLQDAIVPVGEMSYQRAERRFVLVAHRFLWELADRGGQVPADEDGPVEARYLRVHCGLRFEDIQAVHRHRVDRQAPGGMLSLLAIRAHPGHIDLSFADNRTVRLITRSIRCVAEDIGEPWPTAFRPHHELDDGGASAAGG